MGNFCVTVCVAYCQPRKLISVEPSQDAILSELDDKREPPTSRRVSLVSRMATFITEAMKELIAYWRGLPRWKRVWPAIKICRTVAELRAVLRTA